MKYSVKRPHLERDCESIVSAMFGSTSKDTTVQSEKIEKSPVELKLLKVNRGFITIKRPP